MVKEILILGVSDIRKPVTTGNIITINNKRSLVKWTDLIIKSSLAPIGHYKISFNDYYQRTLFTGDGYELEYCPHIKLVCGIDCCSLPVTNYYL